MAEGIEIHKLFDKYYKKQQRRLKIYHKIFNKIIYKIKSISNKGQNVFSTFFIIPEYQFGCPLYDQTTCIAYAILKLRKVGFDVTYTHPNFIYISWHKFINTHRFQTQPLPDDNRNFYKKSLNPVITKPRKMKTFFTDLNEKLINESNRAERSNTHMEILENVKNRAELITRFDHHNY